MFGVVVLVKIRFGEAGFGEFFVDLDFCLKFVGIGFVESSLG